jgi:hypothetical protein
MNNLLKINLSQDKIKLIERYGLISTADLKWVSKKENSHELIYFTHSFLTKSDILGLIFRINRLCFAKIKYFRAHLDSYEPYLYDAEKGFEKTEWWNSDFLKHKASGFVIDYRYLQRITRIEDFKMLCARLEGFELNK